MLYCTGAATIQIISLSVWQETIKQDSNNLLTPILLPKPELRKMSSTEQQEEKHMKFVSEPMGDKEIGELSGVEGSIRDSLVQQGFDRGSLLLGKFLFFKKDELLFTQWLVGVAGADSEQAGRCFNCLKEWCESFL